MPRTLIVTAVSATAVALLGAAAVLAYDETRGDRIADGVRVGTVDVSGLTAEQAQATLQRRLVAPARRSVVVRAGDRTFRLTAREARMSVDVPASVADALRVSRSGTVAQRTWRSVTGRALDVAIEPAIGYDHDAVSRLVDRTRVGTQVAARDATVAYTAASVQVRPSRSGRVVNTRTLRAAVARALTDPARPREIRASMRSLRPEVTTAQAAERHATIITVDRGGFTLRLWKGLRLAKSYRVAVGKAGLETPAGLYDIENKAVNPAWHVPDSDWAGERAGTVVPPGPDNPIKARWMGIYAGAGIHGTDARGSIGSNASHGCIRMLIEDVIDLYDRVPVGTPVYIA